MTVYMHQHQLSHHGLALLKIVTGLPFGTDSQVNHIVGRTNSIQSTQTIVCVHQQQLPHLELLLADDCHRASAF